MLPAFVAPSICVPVLDGRLQLGTWQSICLVDTNVDNTERQVRLWLDAAGEQEIARNQCLPDQLRPDHVASMVLFLAADDSAMCTAQEFVVDGGWT